MSTIYQPIETTVRRVAPVAMPIETRREPGSRWRGSCKNWLRCMSELKLPANDSFKMPTLAAGSIVKSKDIAVRRTSAFMRSCAGVPLCAPLVKRKVPMTSGVFYCERAVVAHHCDCDIGQYRVGQLGNQQGSLPEMSV